MFNEIPTSRPSTPLLDSIDSPAELRALNEKQLPELAEELRAFLLYTVGQTGGHFGAGLGVVELTIALHYVYQTPDDRLVWDVGHQTYPHKILTNRRERMHSMRQGGGLSGFPKRDESDYDTFGVGHSSTSISAALGMAIGSQMAESERKCVAVIGDGAMTAGMAFEALNHTAHIDSDMLVILNDNKMSISPNVGGLATYLSKIWGSKFYNSLREVKGPKLLHVITQKGKGFGPAEEDPVGYHALNKIEPKKTVIKNANIAVKPKYQQVFGDWLCDMAAQDERLVGITPAMCEGSGMVEFAQNFPERFYDVAIAEQHAVTLAAGIACEGQKPVVAIYSTFLQRAYDQLIHDVALQNLDVTFAIDRAGMVGEDGATHAGAFDISFLRCIPNMVIAAPSDENECRQLLYTTYQHPGPAAVRYPRGTGTGAAINTTMTALPLGKGLIKREGKQVAILSFGTSLASALQAAEKLNASVCDMRFVKPLDTELIERMAAEHSLLVTLEENVIAGGAGAAVSEHLASAGVVMPVLHLGFSDRFVEQDSQKQQLVDQGLDAAGIEQAIMARQALLAGKKIVAS